MKHQYRRFLAVLCVFAMLFSLPVLAYADDDSSAAAQKGLEAIKATGDHKRIQLPKDSSYLDEFKTRYVDFSDVLIPVAYDQAVQMYGPSAPVERIPSKNGLQMPFAFQGSTVTVVAEQKDYSCILYRNSNNRLRAGWIWNIYLGDEYPGRTEAIGTENSAAKGNIAEIPMTWSEKGFLKSPQKYTVLEEPVENCVGFTLEYQIIDEGTDKRCAILGPRNVYVNDGTDWIKVGSFEYPELGTVRVRVNLDEPMKVAAIGTIADCRLPNTFFFRQIATDFATTD
ncbi:MAG: hypothetical protein J6Z15_03665 [Oscillospiraceae bacterium]|nr:hypothetical protein [Oscillospiraceae bacterium]